NANILLGGRSNVLNGVTANSSSVSAFPPGNLDTWTNFITITPKPAVFGDGISITLTVQEVDKNGKPVAGQVTTSTFIVNVKPVNHPPTITGANGSPLPTIVAVEAGKGTTNILFTVADSDNDNVTITGQSSDQTLVKDSDIVI